MLVLDSTIGCIEADESQVLVLYRSAPIVMTPVPGSRPASMEVYACAIQGKSQTKVNLVLVADNRRIYVYSESLKATDATGIERSLQQAIGCAKSMGFAPEFVDLNYRPAMREVVLRNIKILRLPGNKAIATLRPGLPGAPLLPPQMLAGTQHDKKPLQVAGKAAAPAPASAIPTPPPAGVVPPAGAASLPAAQAPAASPAVSRGERSSVGVLQLEKELQLMAAERDALLAQLQQLSVVHQEVAMELSIQRDEATRVTADMDRLARSEAELKVTVAAKESLSVEVRDLTAKLQEAQRVAQERHGVNSALATEISTAKNEVNALRAEREALRKKAESATTQAEKVIEENRAIKDELDELRSVSEAELVRMSSLEQDLFTLVAELGTATTEAATARAELAAAVTGVATAEAELVVARSKVMAAEAQIAAMSRKLKGTELELDRTRAELAATLNELLENPPPSVAMKVAPAGASKAPVTVSASMTMAATATTSIAGGAGSQEGAPSPPSASRPTSGSAPTSAKVLEISGKSGKPEVEPKELKESGSSQRVKPSPIEFNEPAPRIPKETVVSSLTGVPKESTALKRNELPEQTPISTQTPVSAQTAVPEQNGVGAVGVASTASDSPAPSGRQGAPGEPAATPPQAHDFPPFGELQDSFFSFSDDPSPVGQFVLRPDLEVIEYLKPEDVVELHQSINNANMAPDGKGPESCCGYICALKSGERLQVFAAIYGTRSGRTSVYAPETQPVDEASYAAVMRSAINFAEEVGLMMEAVKGGAAVLKADCIVQCPVLKKAA
jgi:hypothetical protein